MSWERNCEKCCGVSGVKSPDEWAKYWQAQCVRDSYAPNNEITGAYDVRLAARCANGIFVGRKEGEVVSYKGIPYAKSPVGELRWRPPVAPDASTKVYEAYHFGLSSLQIIQDYPTGEDCLKLNVYVNTKDKNTRKPVMVWIHGGAYTEGAPSDPMYNGKNFIAAHPDVILVTVAYRLGVMGFVDFSTIPGGEAYPDINLGILDQIAALKWVKSNIASFGGDLENMTVFGESAGAGSISILTIVPEAKGLFKRAITQSGSLALTSGRENAPKVAENLAKAFKAQNMQDLLKLTESELREYWRQNCSDRNNCPVRDGRLIPEEPFQSAEQGAMRQYDILQGAMLNEWRFFLLPFNMNRAYYDAFISCALDSMTQQGGEAYREAEQKYLHIIKEQKEQQWLDERRMTDYYFTSGLFSQANAHAKNGGKTYVYLMNQKSDIPGMGACHAADVYYVLGNYDGIMAKGDEAEQALGQKIQQMWVNFAKTGDPSIPDIVWPIYDTQKREVLLIGPEIKVQSDPLGERGRLLEQMRAANKIYRYTQSLPEIQNDLLIKHPEFRKK